MKNYLKHIYYVDVQCYIIREGFIVDIDYGNNHHIGIYNKNRHIIDYALDSHICTTYFECQNILKQAIKEKRNSNFKVINKLNKDNEYLFDKLMTYENC